MGEFGAHQRVLCLTRMSCLLQLLLVARLIIGVGTAARGLCSRLLRGISLTRVDSWDLVGLGLSLDVLLLSRKCICVGLLLALIVALILFSCRCYLILLIMSLRHLLLLGGSVLVRSHR